MNGRPASSGRPAGRRWRMDETFVKLRSEGSSLVHTVDNTARILTYR